MSTMSTNRSQFLQWTFHFLFLQTCFQIWKFTKSNDQITTSNLRFQAHLQRIGEDGLMVFDCFSTARSFLKFHPVFACLCLLKSLRLWILWYPVHRRGSLPFSQSCCFCELLRFRTWSVAPSSAIGSVLKARWTRPRAQSAEGTNLPYLT